jgi:hypothetical protein
LNLINVLVPLNSTFPHMKYCGILLDFNFASFLISLSLWFVAPHVPSFKFWKLLACVTTRTTQITLTQVSTLNQIYLIFQLQHEQQTVVRISSDKIQKCYEWREEMASCITEISHDYDFPLPTVPLPQSNEQWHRTCGYSKSLKGHACLILVRVRGPHLITSVWEFGRLILTDLRVGHLLTSWPMKPETMGNTTRVPTCRYNNHSST